MEKHHYQNNKGFSFVEVIGVLFIICIIISILSFNPMISYEKYNERLALNEVISDIYSVQTASTVSETPCHIEFYELENEYSLYINGNSIKKRISANGVSGTGLRSLKFRFNKGNVSTANTLLLIFKNRKYEVIIHLETGYVTVNEKQ